MAQYIKQGDIFGRIGSGVGQGLAEQMPKAVERGRLAAGLEKLGQQKGNTPFQNFAGLVGVTGGEHPQVIQTGGDLLRQQSIIDSLQNQQPKGEEARRPYSPAAPINASPMEERNIPSATTAANAQANLKSYIPPSGDEQEQMARQMMANEPQIYRTIEEARAAVSNKIAGNVQQSNARIQQGEQEEKIQNRTEQKLRDELKTKGADVPGTVMSNLQQKAVEDVSTGKLSADQAKIKYGEEAHKISQDFADILSWGNMGIVNKNSRDLLSSISSLQKDAKKGGYQKEAADSMIANNGLTPQFAYATMYPVKEYPDLNNIIKELPDIKPRFQKVPGAGVPGLAGVGFARPNNENAPKLTRDIAPSLARAMGLEGSPLSIAYELERKGYDSQVWKDYLNENPDGLNLSDNQRSELKKPKPGFFGWLNDWWLRSFSGVK